jgi:N-acetylmuramoyl-L-alanine amidase
MAKRAVNMIVIHCAATREDKDYTFEDCTRDHKARKFKKCGYHVYIRRDGTEHIGRHFDEVGAHAGPSHNKHSIGICYEGGLDKNGKAKDTRTPIQKAKILKWIGQAIGYSGNKITSIVGHRDLSPDLNGNGIVEPIEWIKQCPCFDAIPEYNYLLK